MSNKNFIETGLLEFDAYGNLTDKQKDISTKIEKLLNGLNYKEAEELLYAVITKTKDYALVNS